MKARDFLHPSSLRSAQGGSSAFPSRALLGSQSAHQPTPRSGGAASGDIPFQIEARATQTWYNRDHTSKAQEVVMVKQFKVIVEKHPDGYVAYPLGLKGVVVGEGDTYEEALTDAKSAIQFHIETFGLEVIEVEPPILEAFVAEAGVAV
jgi:predicted RNase H-like HicB family nuclease